MEGRVSIVDRSIYLEVESAHSVPVDLVEEAADVVESTCSDHQES